MDNMKRKSAPPAPAETETRQEALQMKGYVVFMDVLGFSNRVLRDASMEFFPEFTASLERIIKGVVEAQIDCIVASDSIVIYSKDAEYSSLLALVKACSQLTFSLLNMDLPLRGCISYGSYSRWESRYGAILAGRPIVDAYHYEEQQDWIGVMIAPSVVEKYPPIDDRQELVKCNDHASAQLIRQNCPWSLLIQRCPNIPFHYISQSKSYTYDGYAIVPTRPQDSTPEDVVETIGISIRHLRRLKALAPEPESQDKYTSTIRWLEEVWAKWQGIISTPFWKGVSK